MDSLLLLALLGLASLPATEGLTRRTAKVRVSNWTGRTLSSVGVAHKYSDEYKDNYQWDGDLRHSTCTAASMTVRYNTGFLTTGRDWWLVDFVESAGRRNWITNPKNARDFFDFFETMATAVGMTDGVIDPNEFLLLYKLVMGASPLAVSGKLAAKIVVEFVLMQVVNSEPTAGFKQHILRSSDDGQVTTINLLRSSDGLKVEWASNSGRSDTGTMSTLVDWADPSASGRLFASSDFGNALHHDAVYFHAPTVGGSPVDTCWRFGAYCLGHSGDRANYANNVCQRIAENVPFVPGPHSNPNTVIKRHCAVGVWTSYDRANASTTVLGDNSRCDITRGHCGYLMKASCAPC